MYILYIYIGDSAINLLVSVRYLDDYAFILIFFFFFIANSARELETQLES